MQCERLLRVTIAAALFTSPASGCFCIEGSLSDTFAQADAVFVGTVKSIDPDFDFWDPGVKKLLAHFLLDGSPQALAEFKRRYLTRFPQPVQAEVAQATNREQLNAAFSKLIAPKWITLKVRQTFKGTDGRSRVAQLQTRFDDCGIHFVKGETYLVFAHRDAIGLSTAACSGTRRASQARDDLADLRAR